MINTNLTWDWANIWIESYYLAILEILKNIDNIFET